MILEREQGRGEERERSIDVREKHPLVVSHVHSDCTEPTTQACTPDWVLNPQPLGPQGIAPATQATPARAVGKF